MTAMPTPSPIISRPAPRVATLTAALLLTGALFSPGARAQTVPAAPAMPPQTTMPTDTAPAPPVLPAPPADAAPSTTMAPAATPNSMSNGRTPTVGAEAPPAPEDSPKKSRFRIGPTIGFFLPSDSKTRDRFGSSWFSLGLGLGPVSGVTNKGAIGFDINLLYQQHNGNHALIVPLGVGYRVALVNTTNADGTKVKNVPYAGVTADYYVINFKSNPENINGTYGAGGGSAILGVNFGDSANLEARYQFASKTRGFDFSGLNLTAGYRF